MKRLAVLLIAFVMSSGCAAGTPFGPPEQPPQFFAFGADTSGFFGLGRSANGSATRPFEGCVFADLNDENNRGRVQVVGWLGTDAKINVDFGLFNGSLDQGGGVSFDSPGLPPTEYPIPFPDVAAKAQAWGNATFEMNDFDYDEPVSRDANWTTYFGFYDNGFRSDADRSVRTTRGEIFDELAPRDVATARGDKEAHLVLRSNRGDLGNLNGSRAFYNPGDASGLITSRSFKTEHFFENRALGSMGRFTITLNGAGPSLAATRLSFAFLSPSGRVLENVTLGGSPLPSMQRVVTVPLDELLVYMIRVTGEATMTSYRIQLQPYAEEELQYEFWWEDVRVGNEFVAWDECQRRLDAREWAASLPTDHSLPRPQGIRLDVVLVGIGATLLVSLFVVKLVLDSVKGAEFRKKMRK